MVSTSADHSFKLSILCGWHSIFSILTKMVCQLSFGGFPLIRACSAAA
jgi:hypothetical protein